MSRTLCIDTSSGTTVALLDGDRLFTRHHGDRRAHAETLAPMIAELCPTPPDLVVVSTGPAPFTGLRVGIATARVYAAASGIPVAGVSVLEAYARSYFDSHPQATKVTVITDARRREVYWGVYTPAGRNDVRALAGPGVAAPSEVQMRGAYCGAVSLIDAQATDSELAMDTFARIAHSRAERGADQPTTPLYLREPDIHRRS
ncbi:MAG: tRNA (adenosine(37)-N6)-threonylcarbamoyltransferase complex dimerization subunit type 1 TsaB [Bowdeniella nasicola]|nr:tRNA (adenosine(37)-N6)-threonylcarbamoyltransferase complex dimerization subunit type 1 TsaB [Bowdeniella nasicola]